MNAIYDLPQFSIYSIIYTYLYNLFHFEIFLNVEIDFAFFSVFWEIVVLSQREYKN